MPDEVTETSPNAGDLDVAALFARLQEEVRRTGPRHRSGAQASSVRLNARAAADRLWPVGVERHIGGRGGIAGALFRPIKVIVRKLVRWYVEPVFADQRAYNEALLRLVDDLQEQVDALRAELRARG